MEIKQAIGAAVLLVSADLFLRSSRWHLHDRERDDMLHASFLSRGQKKWPDDVGGKKSFVVLRTYFFLEKFVRKAVA